jgi:hypothetical protein
MGARGIGRVRALLYGVDVAVSSNSSSGLRLEYSWVRNCPARSSSISSRLGTRYSSMKRSSILGHRVSCLPPCCHL